MLTPPEEFANSTTLVSARPRSPVGSTCREHRSDASQRTNARAVAAPLLTRTLTKRKNWRRWRPLTNRPYRCRHDPIRHESATAESNRPTIQKTVAEVAKPRCPKVSETCPKKFDRASPVCQAKRKKNQGTDTSRATRKPEDEAPVHGHVVVTIRGAQVPCKVDPRPAPQHSPCLLFVVPVFDPLPHIARHILHPFRRRSAGIQAHCCRMPRARLGVVRPTCIRFLIAPRVRPSG
jgi:hypothetical protein